MFDRSKYIRDFVIVSKKIKHDHSNKRIFISSWPENRCGCTENYIVTSSGGF